MIMIYLRVTSQNVEECSLAGARGTHDGRQLSGLEAS